jgi:hypothetical protein
MDSVNPIILSIFHCPHGICIPIWKPDIDEPGTSPNLFAKSATRTCSRTFKCLSVLGWISVGCPLSLKEPCYGRTLTKMCMQYQNAGHTMSLLDETHLIRDLEIGSSVGASSWRRVGEK